jgi:hypothetical protein
MEGIKEKRDSCLNLFFFFLSLLSPSSLLIFRVFYQNLRDTLTQFNPFHKPPSIVNSNPPDLLMTFNGVVFTPGMCY